MRLSRCHTTKQLFFAVIRFSLHTHKDHSDTNIYVKANELYQLNSYNSYNTIIKLNDSFFLDFIAVNTTN